MRTIGLLSIATALALPFGTAAAQDFFAKLDTGNNGVLSDAELRTGAALRGSWIAIDRDQNGRVTRSEFTSFPPAQVRRAESAPLESASAGATTPAAEPGRANALPSNVTVVIVDADRYGSPARYAYAAVGRYPYSHTYGAQWAPSGYPPLYTQPGFEYGPLGVMPPWPR